MSHALLPTLCLAVVAICPLGSSLGKTYTITSSADDFSVNSLRGALFAASSSPQKRNRFKFKIPGNGAKTITLTQHEPGSNVPGPSSLYLQPNKIYIIDATTQKGAKKQPKVIIDGRFLDQQAVFQLNPGAKKNTIKGFQIINFPVQGIYLANNADSNTIQNNYIGFKAGSPTTEQFQNKGQQSGILLYGASKNTISNNVICGVALLIATGYDSDLYPNYSPTNQFGQGPPTVGNRIMFNKLGVMPDGFTKVPSSGNAIYMGAGSQSTYLQGNTLASTNLSLIEISQQTCNNNTFYANFFGTDSTGSIALGCEGMGLNFYRYSPYNYVYSNTISANKLFGIGLGVPATINGVTFEHANNETIRYNNIGLDATGTRILAGQSFGVFVTDTLGAFQTYANNVSDNNVSGNTRYGIYTSNTFGNYINRNAIGTTLNSQSLALGNGTYGLVFDNSSNNQAESNIVKYNGFGNHPGEYGAGVFSFNGSSGNNLSGTQDSDNLH